MSAKHPLIVTVTGPSGSGKTVLSYELKDKGLEPLVSTTTRLPRKGEVDGVDYHFISTDQFHADQDAGKFIENVEYNGVLYGVSVEEARRAFGLGRSAVLVAEPHGVEQIKTFAEERGWRVLRVFVDNPEGILLGRLINRLLMDVASIPMDENRLPALTPWVERLQKAPEGDLAALKNILNDALNHFGAAVPDDQDPRLHAAATRLRSFQFEQTHWVQPARTRPDLYEYVTDRFDQSVQTAVVDTIMGQVDHLEQTPPRPPILKR